MSTEQKAIYLASRHPALDRPAFADRWRRHAALAMSLPGWRHVSGYAHGDVDPDPPRDLDPELPGRWSGEHDALGTVVLRSPEAFAAFHAHRDYPRLRNDEHATFSGLIEECAVLTTEWPILERPGTAARVLAFLVPAPGLDREAFAARWATHAGLVMRSAALPELLTRYVHNRGVAPEAEPPADSFAEFAGVAELGFASVADRDAYLAHPDRAGLAEDLATFTDPSRTVLVATNEITLVVRETAT